MRIGKFHFTCLVLMAASAATAFTSPTSAQERVRRSAVGDASAPPNIASLLPARANAGGLWSGGPGSRAAGPVVLYNNTLVCDPNVVTSIGLNATTADNDPNNGIGSPLELARTECAQGNIENTCDPQSCAFPGPIFLLDNGTTFASPANGWRFVFGTDAGVGPSALLPDFDGDGDVDLGDFSSFSLCYAGPNNPPAGSCPGGVDADFDGDNDVDLGDFSAFSLCYGGANNAPAVACELIVPAGNPIDLKFCFVDGTRTGVGATLGTLIVNDFSGEGGGTASRAIYVCEGLPPDATPADGTLEFMLVEVDLNADPPIWSTTRPSDSMTFTGTVTKDGVVPATADRKFNLPGGAFGYAMGTDDNTIVGLSTISAYGGAGQQDAIRFMNNEPACDAVANPFGTKTTPNLNIDFGGFDNCNDGPPPTPNGGFYFQVLAEDGTGEPNETIDPQLPIQITDAGCAVVPFAIASSPTDVDLYHVLVTSVPAAGLKLAAYAEGIGTPPNRGNPLLRMFDAAGNELASNDSDGRPENNDIICAPHAGVNALAVVDITAPGDYYVGVSGGGADEFRSTREIAPTAADCLLDPAGASNDDYEPISGATGTPASAPGAYSLTMVLGDMTPIGTLEPDDAMPLANAVAALPYDTDALGLSPFMGDGPFGACLGDHDYYHVPDAVTTDGMLLDSVVHSDINDIDSNSFMMVYETDAGSTTANKRLVAASDNVAANFDSRTLTPVQADKDYFVMIMGTGTTADGERFTCFRQFPGFIEFEPGLNNQVPGAGDAIPGVQGGYTGAYRLLIQQIAPPVSLGPFEPNDSIAQAAANAVITVMHNSSTPVTAQAFMGDGLYGTNNQTPPNVSIGDVDIFKVSGLSAGDILEAEAYAQGVSTVALNHFIVTKEQIIATSFLREPFGPPQRSVTISPIIDPNDTYDVIVPDDTRTANSDYGSFLPWDVTIPGTLLSGEYTGAYNLSYQAWTLPPPAEAGSRLWAAYRGTTSGCILELNPDTGAIVNSFAAPDTVNGAATGLAWAATPPGYTSDVLFYLNTWGALVQFSRLYSLDPNTGEKDTSVTTLGFYNLNQEATLIAAVGGTGNLTGSTDGLGYAGGKLWLINQNADVLAEFDTDGPNNARTGNTYDFTAPPFMRECRDGLEGMDNANLGTGHVLFVAARENQVIVVVDVGANGDGPADDDVLVNLGEYPDPTDNGGAGTSNTGGIGVLPLATAPDANGNDFMLYLGNINDNLTEIIGAEGVPGGVGTSDLLGGYFVDFGLSGMTTNNQ